MKSETLPIIQETDKSFWHDYINFYKNFLPESIDDLIVEFGVFKGNSIRWLLSQYPLAKIVGADILPVQENWPVDPRVEYKQLDQGIEQDISNFFNGIPSPTLIIEDGSHIPSHQSRCLKFGINKLQSGGIYILEDIHTSHPKHHLFKSEFGSSRAIFKNKNKPQPHQTSLSVLLALEHIKRQGRDELSENEMQILARGTHFSKEDIDKLYMQIESIHIYKRSTLPKSCYACGSSLFDYHNYKCLCGVDILNEADSMSILIFKK